MCAELFVDLGALEEAELAALAHQGHLPERPIRPAASPPRTQEGARRGQALDHRLLLAHASDRELYSDLAGDYFERRDPQKATKRLVAQLERLGHTVTLHEALVAG